MKHYRDLHPFRWKAVICIPRTAAARHPTSQHALRRRNLDWLMRSGVSAYEDACVIRCQYWTVYSISTATDKKDVVADPAQPT